MQSDQEQLPGGTQGELAQAQARIKQLEQANTELARRERIAATMLAAIPGVVLRISLDERIEYINRVLPEYSGPELVGQTIYNFAPPEEHDRMRAALAQVRETKKPSSFESVALAPDGTRDWYQSVVGPILDGNQITGYTMISTNVSRARRAEAELRESQARLKFALDAGNIGAWRWDIQRDDVEWDEKLCSLFGLTLETAPRTKEGFLALVSEDQKALMRQHIETSVRTGLYPDFELRADFPDRTRYFIIKGGGVRDEKGRVIQLLGGVIDITERKELEEHLKRVQKLELAGLLSAGISHNFNNMLAVIVPVLEMARRDPNSLAAGLLDNALQSAIQAGQLVKQLQVFSRDRKVRGLTEPLSAVILRVFELCRRTFDRRIRLECADTGPAKNVFVDGAQMEQALMNIMINARDALERVSTREPRIDITLRMMDESSVLNLLPDASGNFLELTITDTGHGMEPGTAERIFEPFFSTKATNNGTGLGLSTAWVTLQEHGGLIDCHSTPGHGSRFTLMIPEDTGFAPPQTEPAGGRFTGHGEKVLVVDDEAGVLYATSEMLAALGYRVYPASSGEAALSIARNQKMALAILDHSMPGISPEETLAGLREIQPEIPIISFSGMGATLPGANAHLVKPVTSQTLALSVRSLLDTDNRS